LKFDVLRKIESQLGRIRTSDKFAPRTIDLDMILYGTLVIDEADIKIPDPSIRLYPFVAVPLLELAPKLILPDTHTPLADEPVAKLNTALHLLPEFTEYLRQIFLA
jgi:dihydroneopterin aldolase/2-amino-4-hydroxy-6-hydroxymethyldihydropteridine diphosphokinase